MISAGINAPWAAIRPVKLACIAWHPGVHAQLARSEEELGGAQVRSPSLAPAPVLELFLAFPYLYPFNP